MNTPRCKGIPQRCLRQGLNCVQCDVVLDAALLGLGSGHSARFSAFQRMAAKIRARSLGWSYRANVPGLTRLVEDRGSYLSRPKSRIQQKPSGC